METGAAPLSNNIHPMDIFAFLARAAGRGQRVALVTVVGVKGGGVRAPGALMGVADDGRAAGYVSNGCVDADVITQALTAMEAETARTITYGEGSPFLDIQLPCGGRLDLFILPLEDVETISAARDTLAERKPVSVRIGEAGVCMTQEPACAWDGHEMTLHCAPVTRLRIAGRGAEPIALARMALAADMDVHLQSPNEDCLKAGAALGVTTQRLTAPEIIPAAQDDPWTAVVTMFHDHDWEPHLLAQALNGRAFYVGALGGRKTRDWRAERLATLGVGHQDIERLHGPIGLIPGARDASVLAISTLAEIVAAARENDI